MLHMFYQCTSIKSQQLIGIGLKARLLSVILLLPQTEPTATFVLAGCSIKGRAHKSLSRLIKKNILYIIIY